MHEIGHAFWANQSKSSKDYNEDNGKNEGFIINYAENPIRKQLGMCARNGYEVYKK